MRRLRLKETHSLPEVTLLSPSLCPDQYTSCLSANFLWSADGLCPRDFPGPQWPAPNLFCGLSWTWVSLPCGKQDRAGLGWSLWHFHPWAKRTSSPLLCTSWLLVHMPAACPTSRCPAWGWHMTGIQPAGLCTELEFQQQGQGWAEQARTLLLRV